jgi:glutamate dehydrogenase
MEVFEVEGSRERRLVIGYKMSGTSHFFRYAFVPNAASVLTDMPYSALSNLYHYYQLYSARKYVEQFSNGVTIISLYLNPMPNSTAAPIEGSIFQVMKEASPLYCLSDNPFFLNPANSNRAVQEAMYHCEHLFHRVRFVQL